MSRLCTPQHPSQRVLRNFSLETLRFVAWLLAVLFVPALAAADVPEFEFGGQIGDGTVQAEVEAIDRDHQGNVYLAVEVRGTVDADPGTGSGDVFSVTTTGRNGSVIVKLDATGAFAWAKVIDGPGEDLPTAMEVDGAGNVYLTGMFQSTTNFNPDPSGTPELRTANGLDIFVLKLDTHGVFQWVDTPNGSGTQWPLDLSLDGASNVYVSGQMEGSVAFDDRTRVSNGRFDAFAYKLNASGVQQWSLNVGGAGQDQGRRGAADPTNGDFVFTGGFNSSGDFDPGLGVEPLVTFEPQGRGSFLMRVDGSDGSLIWAKILVDPNSFNSTSQGQGLGVDSAGNILVAGNYNGTLDFDPSANFDLHTSNGKGDLFFTKLTSAGVPLWMRSIGGTQNDTPYRVEVDSAGAIYALGNYGGNGTPPLDFDPGPGVTELGAGIGTFVVKLDNDGLFEWAFEHEYVGGFGTNFQPLGLGLDNGGSVVVGGRFGRTTGDIDPGDDVFEVSVPSSFPQRAGFYQVLQQGDPDLVAYAPLDENTGVIADFGSGLSGDLTGSTAWTPGQQGSAVAFDGSTGYIEVLDSGNSPLDVTTLTVAAWVRPDRVDGGTQSLVSKDNAYELEFGRTSVAAWELRIDNGSPGVADSPVTEGVWQHLAATWDGSTIRYYKNGQPDGSVPHAAAVDANNENLGIGARPTAAASGGPTYFLEGAMDEVRVYSRTLDASEIQALFDESVTDILPPVRSNAVPDGVVATAPVLIGLDTDETADCKYGESGGTRYADLASTFANTGSTSHDDSYTPAGSIALLSVRCRDALGNTNTTDLSIGVGVGTSDISGELRAEWLFEEGAGCTTADLINGQTGDLSNTLGTCDASDDSPQWRANEADAIPGPCFSGQCLAFDGNDQVSVTVVDEIRVLPQHLTVSAWVRHDAISGTFSMIADLRGTDVDSGLQALGFALALDPSGKGYFRVRGTTVLGSTDLDDGQWHHLVGVWRVGPVGVGSTRIYVDGVLDQALNEGSATYNLAASTQLQIGHRFNAGETMHNFKGELDTVSVYDRELSDLEVFDLYLATRP